MGELEQALQELMGFLGGTPAGAPVAGPPTPPALLAGPGGTMTGVPGAPGTPGAAGTPAAPGLVSSLAAKGLPIQQILQIISALGGANLGTDEINQLKQLYAQQQNAARIAQNPMALAKRAAHATLPINKELAYTVDSAADANSANAGMAQSPGAVASARAQALAPLAESNVQMGAQMSEFGLPTGGFGAPNVPDYMSVLRELNQFGQGTGGGTYSLPSGI